MEVSRVVNELARPQPKRLLLSSVGAKARENQIGLAGQHEQNLFFGMAMRRMRAMPRDQNRRMTREEVCVVSGALVLVVRLPAGGLIGVERNGQKVNPTRYSLSVHRDLRLC